MGSFARGKIGTLVYLAVMIVLLGWMVKCSATLGDKANWQQTTGRLGGVGSTSTKGGGKVTVYYKDPSTGEEKSAHMPIPNDLVEEVVNASNAEQPAYVYENIFGARTVCMDSVWDECSKEARPKWWMYLLVVGLILVAGVPTFNEYRRHRAQRPSA